MFQQLLLCKSERFAAFQSKDVQAVTIHQDDSKHKCKGYVHVYILTKVK